MGVVLDFKKKLSIDDLIPSDICPINVRATKEGKGYIAAILNAENRKLAVLFTAFLAEVGHPPSECEMVRERHGTEIRIYFRKRQGVR